MKQKTNKEKKDLPKASVKKGPPPEEKKDEDQNDYGGLPSRNLKKNLGCG